MARDDWALIVGIDEYADPGARLQGAVRDALAFHEWVIDRLGVPPRQVFLSLSRHAGSPAPDPALVVFDATRTGIRTALRELSTRLALAPLPPRRLFIHFAGHGVTSRMNGIGEQAILAADFTKNDPDNSISIPSILDWLLALPVPDQFIFIDGCRNAPVDGRFHVGRMPFDTPPPPDGPVIQQFVFNATVSGLKAFEAGVAGEEGGVFSGELLDALRGRAGPLAWDPDHDAYVVRWRALTDWVSERVADRARTLSTGRDAVVQVPRTSGEQSAPGREADPVLATLDADSVADGILTLDVDPPAAGPYAVIRIFDPTDPLHPELLGPDEDLPRDLPLPPRDYAVAASAEGWRPARRSWPAVLRERLALTLHFERDPSAPASSRDPGAPQRPRRRPVRPVAPAPAGGGADSSGATPEPAPSRLVVTSTDRLARLEIVDSSGRVKASGTGGSLALENPPAGTYIARLVLPEGDQSAIEASVVPGETETIEVSAPTRSVATPSLEALAQAELTHGANIDALAISERLGPMAGAEASTVLAIAAARAIHADVLDRDTGWGHLVGALGVASPPRTGVQVLLVDERFGPDGVSMAQVGIGAAPDAVTPLELRRIGPVDLAAAEAHVDVEAGRRELLLGGPGAAPIRIGVPVIEGHATQLVVHRRSNAEVHLLLQTPATGDEGAGAGADFEPQDVRLLESAQRWMLRSRYDAIDPAALAAMAWSRPVASLLAGYLFLRAGAAEDAARMAERLHAWNALRSDAWVVRSELARRDGRHADAAAACREALRAGLPIFVGGLRLLADAVARLDEAPEGHDTLSDALSRRIAGVLWTAVSDG